MRPWHCASSRPGACFSYIRPQHSSASEFVQISRHRSIAAIGGPTRPSPSPKIPYPQGGTPPSPTLSLSQIHNQPQHGAGTQFVSHNIKRPQTQTTVSTIRINHENTQIPLGNPFGPAPMHLAPPRRFRAKHRRTHRQRRLRRRRHRRNLPRRTRRQQRRKLQTIHALVLLTAAFHR